MFSLTTHVVDFEWHTSQTARVKTLRNDVNMFYRQIYFATEISKSTVWDLNHDFFARRIANRDDIEETKETKKLLTREKVARCDHLLETADWESRSLIWKMLIYESKVKCDVRTLMREMHQLDWWKCIACRKAWTSSNHVVKRVNWVEEALFLRSNSENWNNVRFSDEMHTDFDAQKRVYVIRKSDTDTCASCIQHVASKLKNERDQKRKHVWVAVNYNFKSDLMFYDVSDNSNGKMSLNVYKNKILKSIVKSWILETRANEISFIFEENDDSGHETDKNNICRTWKKNNMLNCYFNVSENFDLSLIENCWQRFKQWIRRISHWDDEIIEHLMIENWKKHMSQRFINERNKSMLERLRDVIRLKNQMTEYWR